MVDNDRSKLQLESDVRLLYNLLERAKKERRSYYSTVLGLQKSVAASNGRTAEVNTCVVNGGPTKSPLASSRLCLLRTSLNQMTGVVHLGTLPNEDRDSFGFRLISPHTFNCLGDIQGMKQLAGLLQRSSGLGPQVFTTTTLLRRFLLA